MKDSQVYILLLNISNMALVITQKYFLLAFSLLFFIGFIVLNKLERKEEKLLIERELLMRDAREIIQNA